MAHTLLEYFLNQKDIDRIHAISDVLLQQEATDATSMVYKGTAYAILVDRRFRSKYAKFESIPDHLKPQASELIKQQRQWYAKAEALGWREETEESRKAYLQMVGQTARLQK